MNPLFLQPQTDVAPIPVDPGTPAPGGSGGTGGGGGGNYPTITPTWGDLAVGMQMANTHMSYGKNSAGLANFYQQYGPGFTSAAGQAISLLQQMRIRHVREQYNPVATLRSALAAFWAAGIDCMLVIGRNTSVRPVVSDVVTELQTYYNGGSGKAKATWVESVNEPDNPRSDMTTSGFVTALRSYHQSMYNALHPLGYKVGPPPMAFHTYYTTVGDLTAYADFFTQHIYPGGWQPSYLLDSDHTAGQAMVASTANSLPWGVSETGYENAMGQTNGNAPIPEDAAGKYGPAMICEYASRGASFLGWYELADEYRDDAGTNDQNHFGLVRYGKQATPTFALKPIGIAIANTNALLDDGGGTAPAMVPLPVQVTVSDTRLKFHLFQRRAGTYVLALWNDMANWTPNTSTVGGGAYVTVPAHTATVTFPAAAQVTPYQPAVSASPSSPVSSAASFTFTVADQPLFLQIVPSVTGSTTSGSPSGTPSSSTYTATYGATY